MSEPRTPFVPRLADLSLEQKVGQVIMGGFPDPAADAATLAAVRDGSLGNVILFARNCPDAESVVALNGALQAAAPIPLLIAADQEGGLVTRLNVGATLTPGAMALGATGDTGLAEGIAAMMADELRGVGINVCLAPTADVNANPANPVIGVRAFGEDPHQVARFVVATVRGLQGQGVAACAKHFPGHGDTGIDSHLALPRIDRGLADLERVDLVSFRAAIAAGVRLVMTTHIQFPALDPDHPSTLSHAILTGLLCERLGFQGVVITDSMEMRGITQDRTPAEACLAAFAAGADIVCPSHERADQAGAHALILAAVRDGRVPLARLDEAVTRVLALKQWLADEGSLHADPSAFARLRSPDHEALAREAATRAVTLLCHDGPWPPPLAGRVAVVEFGQPRFTGAEEGEGRLGALASHLAAALETRAEVHSVVAAVAPTDAEASACLAAVREADALVIGTRSATLHPAQVEAVQRLLAVGKPTTIIGLRTPYDLAAFPEAPTYLATYGDAAPSLAAVAAALVSPEPPLGALPVTIPGLYRRGYSINHHPVSSSDEELRP